MADTHSFTQGKILGPLLKFALPVMFALVLQSLYGAVDLMVVGQYASSAQVSAVATGSQVMSTITNIIAGLSMGTTILLGQQLGEGRREDAGRSMGASIIFFAIVAVAVSAVMLLNINNIVNIMQAPAEAYDATCSYVRICSMGMIFIVAYNVLGALFRGLGNSRIPLIAVAIAAVINIFGDLFFVAYLNMGASGAAIATVVSQAIAVLISFVIVTRIELPFDLEKKEIRFNGAITKRVVHFGFPLALADALVGISFLIIMSIVNSLGVTASAGVGVAEKVCSFVMLVPSAFGQSMAAFVAQNYGAKKLDRAHKTLRYGIAASLLCASIMAYLSFFHGDILCGFFSKDAEVVAAGWDYLRAYAVDCFFTSIFFSMNGYFNGCGETKFVMIQSIVGAFCVRVPVSYFMSKIVPVSLFMIGLATPASSLLQCILCIIYLFTIARKKEKQYLDADAL